MAEATVPMTALARGAAEGAAGGMAGSGASAVAQTLLWLLVIVALILLLAWAARRFSGLTQLGGQGMKVLGALPLSHRERAVLVQVGDKQMLLGVAPGNVSMLHVFEAGELQRGEFGAGKEGEGGFRSVLQQALNRKQ